ncbi:MAG: isochorismatase family protein [Armatimonadota bacterium]|nr:isochorismatase family protein [Armatimonadota bacterium]
MSNKVIMALGLFIVISAFGMAQPSAAESMKGTKNKMPDKSFLQDCVFVSVDFQQDKRVHRKKIPPEWKKNGWTLEDTNAATDFLFDIALPNARRVADSFREMKKPLIFIYWGYQFKDGMDLAPAVRQNFMRQFGTDVGKWPHHISLDYSRPAEILGVKEGEYSIAKTDWNAFSSSNINFILQNLGAKNLVFVGGHSGACLRQTAEAAKKLGYKILCIEDGTSNAVESSRKKDLEATGYDYIITTDEFLKLAKS